MTEVEFGQTWAILSEGLEIQVATCYGCGAAVIVTDEHAKELHLDYHRAFGAVRLPRPRECQATYQPKPDDVPAGIEQTFCRKPHGHDGLHTDHYGSRWS